ncbi:hypothetical protein DIPPA_08792, partial [Diplonema papillatum]
MILILTSLACASFGQADGHTGFLLEFDVGVIDCLASANVTLCCELGNENQTDCAMRTGCRYESDDTCTPSPTPAPETPSPEDDDGGPTIGGIILFFFTYLMALGAFYGGIRLARHFGHCKTGSVGE